MHATSVSSLVLHSSVISVVVLGYKGVGKSTFIEECQVGTPSTTFRPVANPENMPFAPSSGLQRTRMEGE